MIDMDSNPIKILVIGQTPPPYHGQAMMIQRLVQAKFNRIQIFHVRLAFSNEVSSIGKFSFSKIFHLFSIILKTYKIRIAQKDLILYYLPSGPNLIPIIRDLLLLFFVKPLFKKKVYHFRAAGISEYLMSQPKWFQLLCKKVYGSPDVGIQLSLLNPEDAGYFKSKRIVCIPNGLEDEATPYLPFNRVKDVSQTVNLLFVGILREDKGLTTLLRALSLIVQKNIRNIHLTVMGAFASQAYEDEVKSMVVKQELFDYVSFVGVQTKNGKWEQFLNADILCFPTYFHSESFGNVLVEAMMFNLPVIATAWRGIPDIVTKETGMLVPIKNEIELADKMILLIQNQELRIEMGENARKRFLEKYTLSQHLSAMEAMFYSLQ